MGLLLSYRFTLAVDMTDALYQCFVLLGPALAEPGAAGCGGEDCLAPFPVESGITGNTAMPASLPVVCTAITIKPMRQIS